MYLYHTETYSSSANDELLDLRLHLFDNGYEPIPLLGKDPQVKCWPEDEMTEQRIRDQRKRYPSFLNTGLRTGKLVVADVDITPKPQVDTLQRLIFHVIGGTPLRRFGSKGIALFYRMTDDPIKKINIRSRLPGDLYTVNEKTGRKAPAYRSGIELLGWHNQVAAFGKHPKTGRDYQWIGGASPLTVRFHDLPMVSSDQLHGLAEVLAAKLAEFGYDVKPTAGGGSPQDDAARASVDDITADDITRLYLNRLPPSQDRNGWHNVNCPACGDRECKGGFRSTGSGGWRYSCFHAKCEYHQPTGWEPGRNLGGREKRLFEMFGGDPADLPRIETGYERYLREEMERIARDIREMDEEAEWLAELEAATVDWEGDGDDAWS